MWKHVETCQMWRKQKKIVTQCQSFKKMLKLSKCAEKKTEKGRQKSAPKQM